MKKVLFLIYLVGCLYFALPTPELNPQVNGYRSLEPGDTGQVPHIVAAYYTNQSRQEIINLIKKQFQRSRFFLFYLPLPTYQMIYPPEYAKKVIRKTHQSWHFVELIHWQRESLFISFWEPGLRNKSLNLHGLNYLKAGGKKWNRKVTFYYLPTNLYWREIIWTLELIAIYNLLKTLQLTFSSIKKKFLLKNNEK